MKNLFGHIKTIHIVGIGGIGMSSIAEFLLKEGLAVSGSDARESSITKHLQSLGITFYKGHSAKNIQKADLIVHSSAVKPDNPEILEANLRTIPVIKRPALLREIVKLRHYSIGVAGTHGKTSTSSLLASVLCSADLDPTLIVGGIDKNLQSNSRTGSGPWLVIEADEYDRTFLSLEPAMGIVTSIDVDHLDIYKDLNDIQDAFLQYCNAIPFWGQLLVCSDDPGIVRILPRITSPVTTYGFKDGSNYRVSHYTQTDQKTQFSLEKDGVQYGPFELSFPGKHNILNASAVAGLCLNLSIPLPAIQEGLATFRGVERRFDLRGVIDNIAYIDDYAHHPAEIKQTLAAVKGRWPDKKILCIFQPHLYSRTRDFADDFAQALSEADETVITGIYPAREKPIPGITSQLITEKMTSRVYYLDDIEELTEFVRPIIRENMVVIAMGAGNITHYFNELVNRQRTLRV